MGTEDREALERFVYDNEDMERLKAILDEFNPFEAMRWTRQELRHSAFLRWLLDPSETHGLGSYFLRVLLKRLARDAQGLPGITPSVIDVDGWGLAQTQVLQEWESIDILIRDDEDRFVVVIEAKVDTSEHSQQLLRYREAIERRFPEYHKLFVYLTAGGDPPSDDAYVPVGHGDMAEIVELTIARRGDQLSGSVRDFLVHYVRMVRRHIVEESEIQDLCRKIYARHRRALDVLFEHRPDRQSEISDFLISLISGTENLTPDHSTKAYVRFWPKALDFLPRVGAGWTKTGRLLLFELDSSGGGLMLKLVLGPGLEEQRERIRSLLASHPNTFNKAATRVYPKWWTCHSERWLTAKQVDALDLSEVQALLQNRFNQFLRDELPSLERDLMVLRGG